MLQRPSARILLVDGEARLLLFRFEHRRGALAGQSFWATPGGGVDPGESFEDAARRELREETGIEVVDTGPQVARRIADFTMPSGEAVQADERYFLVRVADACIAIDRHTELEREVMAEHRWWRQDEIAETADQVWPEDVAAMLVSAGVWPQAT